MNVITVAPIKRGIPIDELSYFTKETLPKGALVTVPLRGRPTPALVIRSTPVHESKSEIKKAEFSLKKLEQVRATEFFSPAFIDACDETAAFFAASTGAIIQAVFSNVLLASKNIQVPMQEKVRPHRIREQFIFQAEESERRATYKSHIREVFARGASCFFILPSVQDIEHTYESLEKGIQEYTFIIHGGLTKKTLEERWKKILEMEHPVLIIGTPFFLAIPRHDIETVILDKESASTYTLQGRPFVDMRFFVERFTKAINADLIFGDLFLRTETLFRKEQGEFEALMRPKSRIPSTATQEIIDMRTSGEQPATGRVAIYSATLVDRIKDARTRGAHTFILGIRRGYAPMTVCGDCGTVFSCERCSAPIVLHKKTGEKDSEGNSPHLFLCHRCGYERDADVTCKYCGGWRMVPLGIGIAQAEEVLKKRFPGVSIFRVDRDSIKNHKEAQACMREFYQSPGSILIGTEMAIPYLTLPVSTVGILSVNSLLTIPDFRMGEKVFRLLLSLREKAQDYFAIQTRDPDVPLFALATAGNIGEFLRTELETRQELGYPPYSTLIKFTYEGKKADGVAIMKEIETIFGIYHPVTFPSFIARVKGKYRMNALLKIPRGGWPNSELLELIRALPTEVQVRINPESVI